MSDLEFDDQFFRLNLTDLNSTFPKISFIDVKDVYSASEDLKCVFDAHANSTDGQVQDKPHLGVVGLFRVGWSSIDDYLTAVEVSVSAIDESGHVVIFKAETLPKENQGTDYYQFCFATLDGNIRGISTPFTFFEEICVEDLENDLLIIQSRTSILEKKLEQTLEENENILKEKDRLMQEVHTSSGVIQNYEDDLKEKNVIIDELRAQTTNLEKRILEEQLSFKDQLSQNECFISSLRVALATARKEKEELETALNAFNLEKNLSKESTSSLQTQLRNVIVNEAALNLEIISKSTTISQLRNNIATLEKSLNKTVAKLKDVEEKLMLEQNMLAAMSTSKMMATHEIEKQIQKYDELTKVKGDLEQKYIDETKLRKNMNDLNSELNKHLQDMSTENSSLNDKILNVQQELMEERKQKGKIQKEVSELQNRIRQGADEYRNKYLDWHKSQKKVKKLESYIRGSTIEPQTTDSTAFVISANEIQNEDFARDQLKEEQKAHIIAEMENQLQMFKSSNSPIPLPSQPVINGSTHVVQKGGISNDADRNSEFDELHSNSSSESQFFDIYDHNAAEDNYFETTTELNVTDTVPPELRWIFCPVCREHFPPDLDLNEHLDRHLYHICPICTEYFNKESGFSFFERHVNSHL